MRRKRADTRRRKTKKIILVTILVAMLAGITAGGAYIYMFVQNVPKIDPNSIYESIDKNSYIYDKNGTLIDTLFYTENREIVSGEEFPDHLKYSFIAIEDKTFYTHHGINLKRMFGAVWNAIRNKEEISGTSTITQQLARNVFLADIKSQRSLTRKATEIVYSLELEKNLDKDTILESYLNTVYFGFGCYGISSAADTYFSKDVDELTLAESALLAALPQSPDVYALIKTEEGDNTVSIGNGLYANKTAESRRNIVLSLMVEQGYITEKEASEAKVATEDLLDPHLEEKNYKYTYFKSYLIEQLKEKMSESMSMSKEEAENYIYTGGLKIYTTIDPDAQDIIIEEFHDGYNFPGTVRYDVSAEAAMVITEVGTGHIVAMVGGRDGIGENLFNRATSPRQPGSSIKPLSVYSAALQKSYECEEEGKTFPFYDYKIDSQGTKGWGEYLTTSSFVRDEKTYVQGSQWPNNVTRTFSGSQNFRTALQQSINTCAVKILYQVGFDYSSEMLKKYGISTIVTDTSEPYNDVNAAALGLGAMTKGATPLDMAAAYSVFPNGGIRKEPVSFTKVEDPEGSVIVYGEPEETRVLDEGVAWIMTDVLRSVVTDGIARSASIYGTQVGGKTGTTNDKYDFWFCGFTPKYSAALWIGTDKNVAMTGSSDVASRLWSKIMRQIPEVTTGEYRSMPSDVVRSHGEYYTRGTEPYEIYDEEDEEDEETEEEKKEEEPPQIIRDDFEPDSAPSTIYLTP